MNFNFLFLIFLSIISLTLQYDTKKCSKDLDICRKDCSRRAYKLRQQCQINCSNNYYQCLFKKI